MKGEQKKVWSTGERSNSIPKKKEKKGKKENNNIATLGE